MRFFKLARNQSERKCWIVRLPQRPGFLSFCPSSTNREYSFIPHAAAKPPGIAKAPREESWVAFVGMLMFPIPESAKFLTLVLGQSIFRTSTWVGCSASLLLCRVVCFPSFSFLWVQMLLLVLWVLVHYWSKHRACTNNTWTEVLWKGEINCCQKMTGFYFHCKTFRKLPPAPSQNAASPPLSKEQFMLKVNYLSAFNIFFFNVSLGGSFFTLRLISDYQISLLLNMLNNSIFLPCCLFQ